MKRIRPVTTAHHVKTKPFIFKELVDSTHVFVRVDRPRRPLDQPYEGPFPIIERVNNSVFRINFKDQAQDISIDRLKPAFLESTPLKPESMPQRPLAIAVVVIKPIFNCDVERRRDHDGRTNQKSRRFKLVGLSEGETIYMYYSLVKRVSLYYIFVVFTQLL